MADIFKNIRRFLFGWANREFLIFLFYLIVAGIFWLLTTLNESFEVCSNLRKRVVEAFRENGITIPYNTLDVNISEKK